LEAQSKVDQLRDELLAKQNVIAFQIPMVHLFPVAQHQRKDNLPEQAQFLYPPQHVVGAPEITKVGTSFIWVTEGLSTSRA
jgi:hypothetical protein